MTGAATGARLGVVSDTHGWLDPALLELFAGVDLIVHGGDVGNPQVLQQLQTVAPVLAVRGNIDGPPLSYDLPLVGTATWAGLRIVCLHIAGKPGRMTRAARAAIEDLQPHVFVCGHSHLPIADTVGQTLWLNPGAAGRQGFHQIRTAMVLQRTATGQLAIDDIVLGPR